MANVKYPWDKWFNTIKEDGKLQLQYGRDYTVSTASMRGSVVTEARNRGKFVHVDATKEGILLVRLDSRVGKLRGRHRKYPWGKWLAKKKFTLLHGKDYTVSSRCMGEIVRLASRKAGFYASINGRTEGRILVTLTKNGTT